MSGRFVTAKSSLRNALVFVVSFTDAQGNVTRHPMSPTWPLEVLNTMTLMERDGKTTLMIRSVPINATEVEHKTFESGREGMRQGFNGTYDQVAAYLAKE